MNFENFCKMNCMTTEEVEDFKVWLTNKNGAESIKYVKMPWPGNSTGTCRTYYMDYLPTLERSLLQQGKTKLDTVYVNCKPKE